MKLAVANHWKAVKGLEKVCSTARHAKPARLGHSRNFQAGFVGLAWVCVVGQKAHAFEWNPGLI